MPRQDEQSALPIARVSAYGETSQHAREVVFCERLGATVDLSQCRQCAHRRAIVRGADYGGDALICESPAANGGSLAPLLLPRVTVAELMVRNVVCVRPDLSLDALMMLFVENRLGSAPVVDETDEVLGTVSEADALLAIQSGRSLGASTALDVMNPGAHTITESTSVTRAAAIMAFEGISTLVVVSMSREVVGVLACRDILHWLGRADGYVMGR